ncbi:hypothetical protein L484_025092 [Morus notabilis]|uniref:Uncharacterized protein n=1 Tax=Morus notabilis TaxID=981085 RepID=W9RAK5_9ROSA|nr:hypothetical protein L484_025092 [Morus notabilis]
MPASVRLKAEEERHCRRRRSSEVVAGNVPPVTAGVGLGLCSRGLWFGMPETRSAPRGMSDYEKSLRMSQN